jgi:hypothetical protein
MTFHYALRRILEQTTPTHGRTSRVYKGELPLCLTAPISIIKASSEPLYK